MIDAFTAFEDEPRWVAWRVEERGGKPTKMPYSSRTGRLASATDPATWATHLEVEGYVRELLDDGQKGGCGIVLGDLGDGGSAADSAVHLCGTDLDSCLDESGSAALWAVRIITVLGTYSEVSPSGRGLKAFFFIASHLVRRFLDLVGVLAGVWGCKRGIPGLSGADHGPAIELYTQGRYFTVTGRLWSIDHQRIRHLDWPQLEALAALIPPPSSHSAGGGSGNAGEGVDTSRSGKAWRAALDLGAASFEEMCAALRSHADPEIRDWVAEKGEAYGGRELQRLWDRAAAEKAAQAEKLSEWERRQPPADIDATDPGPSAGPSDDEEIIDDDAEILRLVRLKPLDFEREAKAAAKRLGCGVAALRKLVALARGDGTSNKGQGQPLELPEIEPWPKPVAGDWLLEAVIAAIQRYVIIGQPEVRAVALWTVAAHCFALFPVFPRLFITAAEKQCGKTTLLDVLSLLTPRPLAVSNISPAALFRSIAAVRPTLLLDEFDGYTNDTAEELRQIINAGHKLGGAVLRVVGDHHEPRQFDAYSPMAIAAIGSIAGTVMDRSITIGLNRRLASEAVTGLRLDRAPELHAVARQIARWTTDHAAELTPADPAMGGLINRTADNWRPLFAVAELAGDGWSDLAHDTAATLVGRQPDEASIRVRLLFDIRGAFAAAGVDRLRSEALVDYLVSLEDRPWPEWGKTRKPISKVQVARLLQPLHISPGSIRLPDGTTRKGYYRRAFKDAFARYLSTEEGSS
jgi:Protein of unknown function (DUF3631)